MNSYRAVCAFFIASNSLLKKWNTQKGDITMIWYPQATVKANLATCTWVQISTKAGSDNPGRKYARLENNSTANTMRFICLGKNESTTGLDATDGSLLATASDSNTPGGIYEENYDNISAGHIYVYTATSTIPYRYTEGY